MQLQMISLESVIKTSNILWLKLEKDREEANEIYIPKNVNSEQ